MQVPAHRFVLLAFALLLTGCGGGGGGGSSTPVTPVPVTPAPTLSVSQTSGPLTATLTESAASIAVTGTVTYTLSVKNSSSAATTLLTMQDNGQTAPIASVTIRNAAGQTVYPVTQPLAGTRRPLGTPPPPPGLDGTPLAPGQSLSLTRTVAAFHAAGTYSAVAMFTLAASSLDTGTVVTLPALAVTVR